MIKWIIFMPFIWLMDYLYGIINPNFRESYLMVQENLTEYMQEQQDLISRINEKLKNRNCK